jgi:hypothetical protein
MPWSCKSSPCNTSWILITENARSIKYPEDGPVKIWRCRAGGHFCASNDEHGDWQGSTAQGDGYGMWNHISAFFFWDGMLDGTHNDWLNGQGSW